jgi:hypothetical protein
MRARIITGSGAKDGKDRFEISQANAAPGRMPHKLDSVAKDQPAEIL